MPIPKKKFNHSFSQKEHVVYKTICDTCHKPCEVPFKPNGKKPVLCDTCFSSTKEVMTRGVMGGNTKVFKGKDKTVFDTPENVITPQYNNSHTAQSTQSPDIKIAEIKRELASANAKLDKLIDLFTKLKK